MISPKIREIALSYEGAQEIRGNAGFVDAKMEQDIRARGWSKGQAWCAYFAELIWHEAYQGHPVQLRLIDQLFSAMATVTFRQFKEHANALAQMKRVAFFQVSQAPTVGAVVIWKLGNGPSGHAGIVVEIRADGTFVTIEGNTTGAPNEREGWKVAKKVRHLNEPFGHNKLNLVGFVLPYEPQEPEA